MFPIAELEEQMQGCLRPQSKRVIMIKIILKNVGFVIKHFTAEVALQSI